MAIADPRLNKIVSLKRRAAESRFLKISKQIRVIDSQIQSSELKLQANRTDEGDAFSGDFLAAERFTQKLLINLKKLRHARTLLSPELARARFELQKIIVSEEVLDKA